MLGNRVAGASVTAVVAAAWLGADTATCASRNRGRPGRPRSNDNVPVTFKSSLVFEHIDVTRARWPTTSASGPSVAMR
jgi:hypothetical protein